LLLSCLHPIMTFYIYSKAGCVVIDAWLVDCVQLQIQSSLTH